MSYHRFYKCQGFFYFFPYLLIPKFGLPKLKRAVAGGDFPDESLAQAYRASGQMEKSRTTAKEGLALLPALPPGSVKPNIRKLLENEAPTRF